MCNNNRQGTENYEELKKQTAVMINECPWKVMTGGKLEHAAAWLVFSEPKRAHFTPLFVSMHWLPVVACIKFKTLMLAYKTTTGSAPTYFHSLLRIYIPPEVWDLWASDASWCHHREAQNHSPKRFHSPFLAGGMNFPPPSGILSPWQFSSNTWKLISSVFCSFFIK